MVSRLPWSRILIVLLAIIAVSTAWVYPAGAENFDRQNLRMVDLSNQDLRDNNYTRADMAEANLSNANLRGVRLFDTTLVRANLSGADMTGATLDGARFTQADLTNAILEGAYAFGTDFRDAKIEGADFTDVLLDPKVNDRLCEVAQGVNPVTKRATRDTLYCP